MNAIPVLTAPANKNPTSASAAPTTETPASAPWRDLGTMGARIITSIPNPQRTISGAILYKSWRGGNIYFNFTASATLRNAAVSSPGGITATGSGSPIQVTGLSIGISYTFTVYATNSSGNGPASDPSNAVTPAPI